MACIIQNNKDNFLRWSRVYGDLTIEQLQASGIPDFCDPSDLAPPTDLTATSSFTEVTLNWNDNTVNEIGYEIYRSTTSGFTPSAANLLDTVGQVTTYSDTTATPSVIHYYVIRAYNLDGFSAFSNEASGSILQLLIDASGTSAAAAYSVARRLTSTYSGSLIRIRRDSDNAEQDIGYNANGDLDTAAITTFVGANSAYIVTMYDQSGNSKDATNATASFQPRIVNAGTLDTYNSLPAGEWSGNGLVTPAISSAVQDNYTVTFVGDVATGTNGFLLDHQTINPGAFTIEASSGAIRVYQYVDSLNNVVQATASANPLVQGYLLYDIKVNGNLYKNGSLNLSSLNYPSPSNIQLTTCTIGNWDLGSNGRPMQGQMPELVIWEAEFDATARGKIDNNINGYYSIY